MERQDDKEHGGHQGTDSTPSEEHATGNGGPAAGAQCIETNNLVGTSKPAYPPENAGHPDQTTVIETSRIREPDARHIPNMVMVPVETSLPSRGRSGAGDREEKLSEREGEKEKGRKGEAGQEGHGKKDSSDTRHDRKDERGHPSQSPSLTRILLYSGLVALVCGIAGAWCYSYFFGPSKSADQKSSGKDSESAKEGDSGKDSASSQGSDSSQKDADSGKLLQAQAAWLTVVKELHQAQAAVKESRSSEEMTKGVLEFFKRTLLSGGRSGDASLAEAFWSGGQRKDMTLRQAMDLTEPRVADTFAEQPLAEARVREMLGLGYLNVGDAAAAVKQYERALLLHQAIQGNNHADTAACRNQLAVAYRLAGRTAEAGSLFDRNLDSPAEASALALSGSMLLLQKKPAEAELKLRESLNIRQKTEPEDWTTFDTKSILGEALLDQKKYSDAEPLLVSGYEGMKQREGTIPSPEKPRVAKALQRLVKLYDAWGKKDEAMKWRKQQATAG